MSYTKERNSRAMVDAAARFIREHDDILFIAHISPDGDTLGSCLALYQIACQMNKHAQVVCEERVPAIYRFLPEADRVLLPRDARQAEAVMCVDCADIARAGICATFFHTAAATFNIDHHDTNQAYADGNFIRMSAATGELVYQLLLELQLDLTESIASCIFTAISTDTGNFAYSNTTSDTFRIAASLTDAGIDVSYLNRCLFRTIPFRKIKLLGRALANLMLYHNGRLGMATLTQADMIDCGASGEDAEGIIDSIRDIDTVEIALLIRESPDDRIRVSMRGKSIANVGDIALALGGGGHRFSAGCTLDGPLQTAVARVREAAEIVLTNAKQ